MNGLERKCIIDHPIMLLAQQCGQDAIERDQGKGDDQYYFKELILLTDIEPCFMCAMALIHCRIHEVIFAHENKFDGGLVSHGTEIHCLKQLNHSFGLCKLDWKKESETV